MVEQKVSLLEMPSAFTDKDLRRLARRGSGRLECPFPDPTGAEMGILKACVLFFRAMLATS